MIPFSLMYAIFHCGQDDPEIRILELAPDSFTFRLPVSQADPRRCVRTAEVFCYDSASGSYRHASTDSFTIESILPTGCDVSDPEYSVPASYAVLYRFRTADPKILDIFSAVSHDYLSFIRCSLQNTEEERMQFLTGLSCTPSPCGSFEEQISQQFCTLRVSCSYADQLQSSIHPKDTSGAGFACAVSLHSRQLEEAFLFLCKEDFRQWYLNRSLPENHPLQRISFTHVYIGNAFCALLLPEEDRLKQLLAKCRDLHLIPIMVFPPMAERDVSRFQRYLQVLQGLCGECECNDPGLMALIREQFPGQFRICAGRMLARRKKDPRLSVLRHGNRYRSRQIQTSLDAPVFRTYLKKQLHVTAFTWESVSYDISLSPDQTSAGARQHISAIAYPGENILCLPFYQMNTASFCTLYAACRYRDRGKQNAVTACPGYCGSYCFLYPDDRLTYGIGNTLFGLDRRVLEDGAYLGRLLEQNVGRLVLNFF